MGEQRAEAPGWDAIDAALAAVYGDREPLHYAAVAQPRAGGSQPLDGISVFRNDDPPHWHFVSYGLSELYGKESGDPELSGWGFELTLRLVRGPEDVQPPSWTMGFLQDLARYVFQTGNPFGAGRPVNLGGPIALDLETRIEAVTFAPDPGLPPLATPNGRVVFLQVVGLTADEKQAMEDWNPDAWLALVAARDPLLLNDLSRESMLSDVELARTVRDGTERDGSSQDLAFVTRLDWTEAGAAVELSVGAMAVPSLLRMARGRVPYGREFELMGPGKAVVFRPASAAAWSAEDEELVVDVSPALAQEIRSTLEPQRGSYGSMALPGFTIRVNPSEIRDGEGRVVRVIG